MSHRRYFGKGIVTGEVTSLWFNHWELLLRITSGYETNFQYCWSTPTSSTVFLVCALYYIHLLWTPSMGWIFSVILKSLWFGCKRMFSKQFYYFKWSVSWTRVLVTLLFNRYLSTFHMTDIHWLIQLYFYWCLVHYCERCALHLKQICLKTYLQVLKNNFFSNSKSKVSSKDIVSDMLAFVFPSILFDLVRSVGKMLALASVMLTMLAETQPMSLCHWHNLLCDWAPSQLHTSFNFFVEIFGSK